jgi:BirA family biotin operon repressor/biotin-[acetyl-CoA-carboxylase] ligase
MDRAAGLREALEGRGTPWPAPVEWHEVVVSTNDVARERARAGGPEWTVVLADRQTGGRGRQGRSWASPPGGLYLSLVLRPGTDAVALLPLAAGVAVAEVAKEHGVPAELKWPNDVLVHGRKLAGILAEASSGSEGVEWVVLGIGMNVTLDVTTLRPPAADVATSIQLETGAAPAMEEVAAGVLSRLSVWYDALESRPASVVEAWRERAVQWWGAPIQIKTGDEVFRGRLHDVDESGALIVDLEGGGFRKVLAGEVARLRSLPVPPEG